MKMTRSKWRMLSTHYANASAIFLGSMVIPLITGQFDTSKWYVVGWGLALTVAFAYLSLLAAEEGKL